MSFTIETRKEQGTVYADFGILLSRIQDEYELNDKGKCGREYVFWRLILLDLQG